MPLPESGNQIFKCVCCGQDYSLMNMNIIPLKRGKLKICSWCYRQLKTWIKDTTYIPE